MSSCAIFSPPQLRGESPRPVSFENPAVIEQTGVHKPFTTGIWAFEPHQTGDPSFLWILSGQERRLLKGLSGFACCRGNARRVRHKQPQIVQSRDFSFSLCMA
jgi:hypothetical protein